jgi:hypothetical protein
MGWLCQQTSLYLQTSLGEGKEKLNPINTKLIFLKGLIVKWAFKNMIHMTNVNLL